MKRMLPVKLFILPDIPYSPHPVRAEGIDTGGFMISGDCRFRGWKMEPEGKADDRPAELDQFHLWRRTKVGRDAWRLEESECLSSYPFTWRRYFLRDEAELSLESMDFSPVYLDEDQAPAYESYLPIHMVVFRVQNRSDRPVESALLSTLTCAWPDMTAYSRFDYQHDNLALTGALGGDPLDMGGRIGVSMPDLHSEGIYLQGIEPWSAPEGLEPLLEDFREDGELDSAVPRGDRQGAGAWVKFDLKPDEVRQIPFAFVWHFPYYKMGELKGQFRKHCQYLTKRRGDNAIIWLAEQAFKDYGGEVPSYMYWMEELIGKG